MSTVRLKLVGIKKYCFNPNSFLTTMFYMNEQTRWIMFYRKFTMCRHKYSCFESIVRTLYRTVGLYLIIRMGAKFIFKDKMFEFFAKNMKWLFPKATEKLIGDLGTFFEFNSLILLNGWLLRNCFYSFVLESMAD